ncbi:MAG: DUF2252 domain-containing protein [Thermoplasmata archaeon]
MAVSPRSLGALPRRPTREQRYLAGRALRQQVPRSRHAEFVPPADRPDPIDLLEQSGRNRVPSLLPIRYGRMSASPFAFLRGSAGVMASDLASTPTTGLRVQLGGDAHLCNFGIFATPERDEVFDVNDFDETLAGPWEWDVKRLATSLVVAARENGYSRRTSRDAVWTAVGGYRRAMNEFARMRYLDLWYVHLDLSTLQKEVKRQGRKLVDRAMAQARRATGLHLFPKATRRVRGEYQIREDPPLIIHYKDSADAEASRAFFHQYLRTLPDERRRLLDRYHLVDVAQKVVGVGSVGTVCSVLLLMGDSDVEDPLFLQVKEATFSALEPYAGPSKFANHAQRVVDGQHLIQEASDIFLGWSSLRSRDFYVRQLRDMKFSSDIGSLGPRAFLGQAELCGTALAHAHARTGDPASISGYLGDRDVFDRAVGKFAEAYADQTARDYRALLRAIKQGRLPARTGA